jgi:hypothetical protein
MFETKKQLKDMNERIEAIEKEINEIRLKKKLKKK